MAIRIDGEILWSWWMRSRSESSALPVIIRCHTLYFIAAVANFYFQLSWDIAATKLSIMSPRIVLVQSYGRRRTRKTRCLQNPLPPPPSYTLICYCLLIYFVGVIKSCFSRWRHITKDLFLLVYHRIWFNMICCPQLVCEKTPET